MDKRSKKLELSTETLLSLEDQDLTGATGGSAGWYGGDDDGGSGFTSGYGLGGGGFFRGNRYEGILNSVVCEDASLVCHIL